MAGAKSSTTTMALALGLILMTLVGECHGQCSANFRVGYYEDKCGKVDAEALVFFVVKKYFNKDKDTVADLVRLQFHDCFGCDASLLLEGEDTEKTARPNQSVGGYEIVEEAKVALDKYCPGVVSCADIVVLAARAATFLGGAYWYEVETGRKDGNVSRATEATEGLPSPRLSIPDSVKFFQDRLYNYRGTEKPDPSMNPTLLSSLQEKCPRGALSSNEAFLDQTKGSEFVMDNGYYKRILEGKGILEVDQQLALHDLTRDIVINAAEDEKVFLAKIGPAMRKMGLIGVLTEGENRLNTCKKVR
ncbi:Peroxidase 60 [Bienertia sinuspersici]